MSESRHWHLVATCTIMNQYIISYNDIHPQVALDCSQKHNTMWILWKEVACQPNNGDNYMPIQLKRSACIVWIAFSFGCHTIICGERIHCPQSSTNVSTVEGELKAFWNLIKAVDIMQNTGIEIQKNGKVLCCWGSYSLVMIDSLTWLFVWWEISVNIGRMKLTRWWDWCVQDWWSFPRKNVWLLLVFVLWRHNSPDRILLNHYALPTFRRLFLLTTLTTLPKIECPPPKL